MYIHEYDYWKLVGDQLLTLRLKYLFGTEVKVNCGIYERVDDDSNV